MCKDVKKEKCIYIIIEIESISVTSIFHPLALEIFPLTMDWFLFFLLCLALSFVMLAFKGK